MATMMAIPFVIYLRSSFFWDIGITITDATHINIPNLEDNDATEDIPLFTTWYKHIIPHIKHNIKLVLRKSHFVFEMYKSGTTMPIADTKPLGRNHVNNKLFVAHMTNNIEKA